MARCKDCLYFKRCVVLGVELDMKHDKEADKNCRHFDNKEDYIKVVRCKDCRFNVSNMENDGYDITDYSGEDIVCSRFMTDGMLADDFCSYGERIDTE